MSISTGPCPVEVTPNSEIDLGSEAAQDAALGYDSALSLAADAPQISECPAELMSAASGDLEYSLQSLRTAAPLLLSDLVSVITAVLVSYGILQVLPVYEIHHQYTFLIQVLLTTLVIHLSLGLYPGVGLHPACELRGVVIGSLAVGVIFAAAAVSIGGITSPYLPLSSMTAILMVSLLFPLRMLTRSLCRRTSWWGHPAVIIGSIERLPELQRALRSNHFPGIRLIGQFGTATDVFESNLTCEWLGDYSDVAAYCQRHHVFWAILPRQSLGNESLEAFSKRYRLRFRQIFAVDDNSAISSLWGSPVALGGVVGIHLRERLLIPSHRLTKRVFDVVVASGLILALTPLLTLICLAVKLTSKGPVIYGHRRIGQNGKHFQSLKFRTMIQNADQVLADHLAADPELKKEWDRDQKLKNDPRITWIGRHLRKSSLDELPQLWNVLRGEMSLVGPRPIVDSEVARYQEVFESYSRVRPGITGLWQISGRNNTTYAERVAYDEFYVRNWSPWFDLYILISTVKTVLMREGAY